MSLRHLNDAELNRNLEARFHKDLGYTYCGNTLVALNLWYRPGDKSGPQDWTTGEPVDIYSEAQKKRYRDTRNLPPHVFGLVKECYNGLFYPSTAGQPRDQALVITGESGSGKTFTVRKVLSFIDSLIEGEHAQQGIEPSGQVRSLTNKILCAMPIMDAFGNASTQRNDDSSRFAKMYKVHFDQESRLVTGASIETYLLEKARVCRQRFWERNFHIFYQVLDYAHSRPEAFGRLLGRPWEYQYLNRFVSLPSCSSPSSRQGGGSSYDAEHDPHMRAGALCVDEATGELREEPCMMLDWDGQVAPMCWYRDSQLCLW